MNVQIISTKEALIDKLPFNLSTLSHFSSCYLLALFVDHTALKTNANQGQPSDLFCAKTLS